MLKARTIAFPNGGDAVAAFACPTVSGEDAIAALALPTPRGVIVLNGGASELPSDVQAPLRRVLADGLARVAVDDRLTVVTGGTDAGIFALFGQALGDKATAPCVGVVPASRTTWPGRERSAGTVLDDEERVPLEPHHSHFLLVEGDEWGDETDAMLSLTAALSARAASIAVLAGGGAGARREVLAHARQGREVIVLGGTGRLADELAEPIAEDARDAAAAEIAATGVVTILDVAAPPIALAELIRARVAPHGDEASP